MIFHCHSIYLVYIIKTQSEVLNIILVIKIIAIGHTSTILVCQINIVTVLMHKITKIAKT